MSLNLLGASLYLACGGAVFLLGVLVLRENPGNRLNRITSTMMFFGGFGPLMGGVRALLALYGPGRPVPGRDISSAFSVIWEMFFPSLLLFSLAFPVEKKVLRKYSRFALLLFSPYAFHLVLVLFLGLYGGDVAAWIPRGGGGHGVIERSFAVVSTLGSLAVEGLTRFHMRFFSFVDVVFSIAAIVILGRSYSAMTRPKIRRQLSVILFGLGSCVAIYTLSVPLPKVFAYTVPEVIRAVLISVALLLGTGAIAFAIVSRSFLDVGTVVRRAILLSGASGILVITYFLTARQLDALLAAAAGVDLPLFQTLFVLLAIVFFHPLLGRLEENTDRLLAGDRVAPRNVMRRLGREMTALLDLPTLSDTVVGTLRDALAVERACLVLRDRGGGSFTVRGDGEDAGESIDADHPLARVVARSSEPELAESLIGEIDAAGGREQARRLVERLGARLIVPVQLPDEEECAGFLAFGPKVTGARFNSEEVTLLSILATQVAIAARNARLHEEAVARKVVDEEIAMARSIQQAILSPELPECAGVDVAALSIPSRQVGGDYFDVTDTGGRTLGVAIGDVSGKGVPAALLMSMLHAALHARIDEIVSAGDMMSRLNGILCSSTSTEKFATFFFGIYDAERRLFRYANGGHNYPILLGADGSARFLDEGGLLIGMVPNSPYDETTITLAEGDLLVLYTDGVTEEPAAGDNDDLFGEERLVELLRRNRHASARRIVDAVRSGVEEFARGDGFTDDFTLIALKAVGEKDER